MPDLGAVELGGTKTLVAVGTSPDSLMESPPISTGEPGPTLGAAIGFLESHPVSAVGVASFGPLELRRSHPDYGSIVSTPKPGWSGVNLVDVIASELNVPVALETDVAGAALAEGRWGAAAGLSAHAYVTVGTGVGFGVVLGGRVIRGLSHPEMGHLVVVPHPEDRFEGSCPFHRTCLEGLASGPALEQRFGASPSELEGETLAHAVELEGFYLAQGLRDLIYTFSPERVVIGGGISKLPGFHDSVRAQLPGQLGGYRVLDEHSREGFVTAPGLGDRSGLLGGVILASEALG